MVAVASVVGSALFLPCLIALIGHLWSRQMWVRDGRPIFTKEEQLQIDIRRAQGWTLGSARRQILKLRQSPFVETIRQMRDSEDLIINPAREDELKAIAPHLASNIEENPGSDERPE